MSDSIRTSAGKAGEPDDQACATKTLLERIVEKICAWLMGGIVVLLSVQIFARYVAGGSLPWTGEMATWLFSWCTFMGAILIYIENKHIVIDFLISFLPLKALTVFKYIQNSIIILLLAFLIVTGVQIAMLYSNQTATSIELSKFYLFISLPISCAVMLGYTFYSWIRGK